MTPSAASPASMRGPGLELGERRGDQAGHDGRAAVTAVELRGAPGVLRRSLGERRAAAPVHVHVDEARQHPLPAQVDVTGSPGGAAASPGPTASITSPGQPDPAGAEHASGRHHAAAGQQAAAGEPGVRRDLWH